MDKQIQFSINRNLLIVVSIIILILLFALSTRGGRGRHDMKMMRGQGHVMMQKKMPAGTPVGEERRLMQPPTQAQLEATSTMLQ